MAPTRTYTTFILLAMLCIIPPSLGGQLLDFVETEDEDADQADQNEMESMQDDDANDDYTESTDVAEDIEDIDAAEQSEYESQANDDLVTEDVAKVDEGSRSIKPKEKCKIIDSKGCCYWPLSQNPKPKKLCPCPKFRLWVDDVEVPLKEVTRPKGGWPKGSAGDMSALSTDVDVERKQDTEVDSARDFHEESVYATQYGDSEAVAVVPEIEDGKSFLQHRRGQKAVLMLPCMH
jgi:hypothetical protein